MNDHFVPATMLVYKGEFYNPPIANILIIIQSFNLQVYFKVNCVARKRLRFCDN